MKFSIVACLTNIYRMGLLVCFMSFIVLTIGISKVHSQVEKSDRPFVKGGVYDKPYLYKLATGKALIGGYAEAHFRFEREDGITEELTFIPKRFNLFVFSNVSERFRLAAELEFEEGTEEILLELAIMDFQIHRSLTFRGGMLLTPLGKFNLAHDSPANKLTDRPLVSTKIIPTTLSEPGMGFFGVIFPSVSSRITYEIYAVNGLTSDIIEESGEGTRISAGKHNIEDNNNSLASAGRIGLSPVPELEFGFSWHSGAYNVTEIEGLPIDKERNLNIIAFDGGWTKNRYEIIGEYAHATIDLPESLLGSIFAEKQQGFYLQGSINFLNGKIRTMPDSYFEGVLSYDSVDFDTELPGDTHSRITFGLNFRPTSDSVFKLNYLYNWKRDRNNVETNSAGILFSVATYF
ncbi:hypothetical protein IID62_11355 [candidate division KSB1 bacterium]|nr:hypothetical protein [candidate division KSB1 bacterium]